MTGRHRIYRDWLEIPAGVVWPTLLARVAITARMWRRPKPKSHRRRS